MLKSGLFAAAFAVLALIVVLPVSARAETKIAVVDVEKVLAEGKASKSLQKQIQAKKEAFQKEFADKEKQLKTTENNLLEQKDKLSAEEFAKQRKAYEEKILETRKLFQKRRSSLDEGLGKAMAELRKNIVESAAKIAEQKGYDIIVTKDAVLIAEKDLDITGDVLTQLDAKLADIKLSVE